MLVSLLLPFGGLANAATQHRVQVQAFQIRHRTHPHHVHLIHDQYHSITLLDLASAIKDRVDAPPGAGTQMGPGVLNNAGAEPAAAGLEIQC